MFTGIIQRVGAVASIDEQPFGVRLAIDPRGWSHTPTSGDSIAVDGCCLTIADDWTPDADHLWFDAVRETLDKTSLGDRRVGDSVNLEPSLRADAMLDGHLVQGHVEGTGEVTRVQDDPEDWRLFVRVPAPLMPCVVPKGSIALDGVSLTIASVEGDTLGVALIPTTLERTTLRDRSPGDRINVETDILARTVVHQLRLFAPELMGRPVT
ncbi:MAG: riboflavin synthase [Phycisphaerales bacterium]